MESPQKEKEGFGKSLKSLFKLSGTKDNEDVSTKFMNPDKLRKAIFDHRKAVKTVHALKEAVIYVVFLIFLTCVVVSLHPTEDTRLASVAMIDSFTIESWENRLRAERFYQALRSPDEWFDWVYNVLLPNGFPPEWFFDGKEGSVNGHNVLLGSMRIRQVRMQRESCETFEMEEHFPPPKGCFDFDASSENQDTDPWYPGEEFGIDYSCNNETLAADCVDGVDQQKVQALFPACLDMGMEIPMVHREGEELDELPFWGRVGSLPGDGYVLYVPLDQEYEGCHGVEPEFCTRNRKCMEELEYARYIDYHTRAIFVDFTMYNMNLDRHIVMRLLCEIPPTGGITPTFTVRVLDFKRYDGAYGGLNLFLEVVLGGFVIYFTIAEVLEMREVGLKDYWKSGWNYLDWTNLILFYVSFCLRFYAFSKTYGDFNFHPVTSPDVIEFSNFEYLGYIAQQEINTLAMNCFLSYFKMFKFFQMSPKMSVLILTLSNSMKELAYFTGCLLIVFLGYAFAGSVVYGESIEGFRTISQAFWSLVRFSVGDIDFYEMYRVNRIFGPFFYVTFILLVNYVLMNMFIAIIGSAYDRATEDIKDKPSMVHFGSLARELRRTRHLIGLKRKQGESWKTLLQREGISMHQFAKLISREEAKVQAYFQAPYMLEAVLINEFKVKRDVAPGLSIKLQRMFTIDDTGELTPEFWEVRRQAMESLDDASSFDHRVILAKVAAAKADAANGDADQTGSAVNLDSVEMQPIALDGSRRATIAGQMLPSDPDANVASSSTIHVDGSNGGVVREEAPKGPAKKPSVAEPVKESKESAGWMKRTSQLVSLTLKGQMSRKRLKEEMHQIYHDRMYVLETIMIMREAIIYSFFVAVFTVVIFSVRPSEPEFYSREAVSNQFYDTFFRNGTLATLETSYSLAHYWTYMQELLIPQVFQYSWLNDGMQGYVMGHNKLLGAMRLRQIRVKRDSCEEHMHEDKFVAPRGCFESNFDDDDLVKDEWIPGFDPEAEYNHVEYRDGCWDCSESTSLCPSECELFQGRYYINMTRVEVEFPYATETGNMPPYQFYSEDDLDEYPFWAATAVLPGSGYIVDLPDDALGYSCETACDHTHLEEGMTELCDHFGSHPCTRNVKFMEELEAHSWVDYKTRAMLADFSLFNPSIDRYIIVRIVCEFPTGTNIEPFISIRVLDFEPFNNPNAPLVVTFSLMLMVLVVYYIIEEINEFRRDGWRGYFSDAWNYLDIVNLVLFVTSFSLRMAAIAKRADTELDPPDGEYTNLQSLAVLSVEERNTLAVNCFLCYFKMFKYLTLSPKMTQLVRTLSLSAAECVYFMICIFVVLTGYALAGTLAFGNDINEYMTMTQSFWSLFRGSTGDMDFEPLYDANRVFGPFFFITFITIVNYILMSMFVAIISNAYDQARAESDLAHADNRTDALLREASHVIQVLARHFISGDSGDGSGYKLSPRRLVHFLSSNNDSDLRSHCESVETLARAFEMQLKLTPAKARSAAQHLFDNFDAGGDGSLSNDIARLREEFSQYSKYVHYNGPPSSELTRDAATEIRIAEAQERPVSNHGDDSSSNSSSDDEVEVDVTDGSPSAKREGGNIRPEHSENDFKSSGIWVGPAEETIV